MKARNPGDLPPVGRGVALFLIACVACAGAWAASAQEEDAPGETGALRLFLEQARQRIDDLRSKDPGNHEAVAGEYLRIHSAFPDTEEGKLAAMEAYLLFGRAQKPYKALSVLARIIKIYDHHQTLTNIMDPSKRLGLVVSARLERARIFAEMGDMHGALLEIKAIPPEERTGYAGIVNGANTCYGEAEVLIKLARVDRLIDLRESNQAVILLGELLKDYGDREIYYEKRTGHVDTDVLSRHARLHEIFDADREKVLSDLARLEPGLHSDEAKIMLYRMRARMHREHFRRYRHRPDLDAARRELLRIIEAHPDRRIQAIDSESITVRSVAVDCLREILEMYRADAGDDAAALEVLKSVLRRERINGLVRAHALLLLGDLYLSAFANMEEAAKVYRKALEENGDLFYYPHKREAPLRIRQVATRKLKELKSGIEEGASP